MKSKTQRETQNYKDDVRGKCVFKRTKNMCTTSMTNTTYDVKVLGIAFKSNILFVN